MKLRRPLGPRTRRELSRLLLRRSTRQLLLSRLLLARQLLSRQLLARPLLARLLLARLLLARLPEARAAMWRVRKPNPPPRMWPRYRWWRSFLWRWWTWWRPW